MMKKSVVILALGLVVPPFIAIASLNAQIQSVLKQPSSGPGEVPSVAPENSWGPKTGPSVSENSSEAPQNHFSGTQAPEQRVEISQNFDLQMKGADVSIEFDPTLERTLILSNLNENVATNFGNQNTKGQFESLNLVQKEKYSQKVKLVLPAQFQNLLLSVEGGKLDAEATSELKLNSFTVEVKAGKGEFRTNVLKVDQFKVHVAAGKLEWNGAELQLQKKASFGLDAGKMDAEFAKVLVSGANPSEQIEIDVKAGKGDFVLGGMKNYALNVAAQMGTFNLERSGEAPVSLTGMGGRQSFKRGTGGPLIDAKLQMGSLDLKLDEGN